MNKIVFSKNSSAELSQLPQLLQLEILDEFKVFSKEYMEKNKDKFGQIQKHDRTIYRYRATDFRIYFEITPEGIVVHRVIHKNSLKDFLYRSQLPVGEDEQLQQSAQFWEMIESKK